MSKTCANCSNCAVFGSSLEEKDIETIIAKADEIDKRPLNIQKEFLKKVEHLGIKDKILKPE